LLYLRYDSKDRLFQATVGHALASLQTHRWRSRPEAARRRALRAPL
jgi:AcrR family transcriptional regulator